MGPARPGNLIRTTTGGIAVRVRIGGLGRGRISAEERARVRAVVANVTSVVEFAEAVEAWLVKR